MTVTLDAIVSLCKRRGFIFQSSEIYGGLAATYDYGPLGAELKRNVKEAWWRSMVQQRGDMEGLDAAILMHPDVWRASGHVASFTDPLVDCRNCRKRFRADHLKGYDATYGVSVDGSDEVVEVSLGTQVPSPAAMAVEFQKAAGKPAAPESLKWKLIDARVACPECGKPALTEPRLFNLMFRTHVGPVQEDGSIVYLRPETAQGIFVNFENVRATMRRKLPFGIAQIGKSFRNEVTTKAFIFRTLEFEQMEIEYFCKPETADDWYRHWIQERFNWYMQYGIRAENLRLREHEPDELAHYARSCHDVEYKYPMGWGELEGIANRTDYDLRQHEEHSKKDLKYFDPETNEHIRPYVIEPSAGVDRSTMAFMMDAYDEEEVKGRKRTVLRLHHFLAPIKIAVLPLLKNRPEITEKAQRVARDLNRRWVTRYDDTAAIGKLYRRQDEVGTPFCITIDVESLEDGQATVRHRDSMEQERIPIDRLEEFMAERLNMNPDRLETPVEV